MSTFLIHHPVVAAEPGVVDGIAASVRDAAKDMTAGGWPVAVLHMTYVSAERACLSVVEAEDAATVVETLRRAGSRAARVLPALAL